MISILAVFQLLVALVLCPLTAWIFLRVWNLMVSHTFSLPIRDYATALRVIIVNLLLISLPIFIKMITTPLLALAFKAFSKIIQSSSAAKGLWTTVFAVNALSSFIRILVVMLWWNYVLTLHLPVRSIGLISSLGFYLLSLVWLGPLRIFFRWSLVL